MNILLGFLPFIAFSVLDRTFGPTIALCVGAAIAAALIVRSWLSSHGQLKVLDVGTVVLLSSLAIYTALIDRTMSLMAVRLCVDIGLLLIVLISLAIRTPFTLQYAREQVDSAYWNSPQFIGANYIITIGWAIAFALIVAIDSVMLMNAAFPTSIAFVANILAMAGAIAFTSWYSKRVSHAAA